MQFKVVHVFYHLRCLLGRREVGKGEPSKDAIVEVIIEGVGQGQAQIGHELHELLLLHGERDILNDNGRRDELFVDVVGKIFLAQRVSTESGVGVSRVQIRESKCGETLRLIKPSLASNVSACASIMKSITHRR